MESLCGGTAKPGPSRRGSTCPTHTSSSNGLGVAALVIGIIGALVGLIPVLFFIAGTLGLLAVIFGFVGRARAGRGAAANGGTALSGAILGLISMALATWGLVITVNAVGDAATKIDQIVASATASAEAGDPSPSKSQAPKPLALGAVAKEPPFSLKVPSVSREQTVSSSIDSHKAQGSYVVVRVLRMGRSCIWSRTVSWRPRPDDRHRIDRRHTSTELGHLDYHVVNRARRL
ncbi:hypothetical protein AB0L53_32180 [Nonomuraea sp. NPDC052129]|uniref:hypothetical protein n=1 Tax=Nonomuraea sp. NPDC052129 TaxID=3154651 RepID=UPI00341FFAA5